MQPTVKGNMYSLLVIRAMQRWVTEHVKKREHARRGRLALTRECLKFQKSCKSPGGTACTDGRVIEVVKSDIPRRTGKGYLLVLSKKKKRKKR